MKIIYVLLTMIVLWSSWCFNIYKITVSDFKHITPKIILRCVGVPAVPVGMLMGFLPNDEKLKK